MGPDPRFAQLVAPGTQGDPAAHTGHGWGGWRWRVDQITVDGVDVGLAGRVLGAGESAVVGEPVVGRVVVAVLTNVSAYAAYFQASWDVEYLQ